MVSVKEFLFFQLRCVVLFVASLLASLLPPLVVRELEIMFLDKYALLC